MKPGTLLACKGAILSQMQGKPCLKSALAESLSYRFTDDTLFEAIGELIREQRIEEVVVLGQGIRLIPLNENGTRQKGFSYRHITPLFAGTPEWVVEGLDPQGKPKLLCWCPREFDAALITAALNGERQ